MVVPGDAGMICSLASRLFARFPLQPSPTHINTESALRIVDPTPNGISLPIACKSSPGRGVERPRSQHYHSFMATVQDHRDFTFILGEVCHFCTCSDTRL